MERTSIISARDLVKRLGGFQAVKGISFEVEQAHCVGLLGPNGAGKTTTMRMIMGLSTVSGGTLEVFDTPVGAMTRAVKSKIGLVPQESNLDPDITVSENLEVYGRYFGLPAKVIGDRVPRLLEFMQLHEKGGGPRDAALRRHEAAPDHRPRADQRSGANHPRRADDGPRPPGPGADLEPALGALAPGEDPVADHTLYG